MIFHSQVVDAGHVFFIGLGGVARHSGSPPMSRIIRADDLRHARFIF